MAAPLPTRDDIRTTFQGNKNAQERLIQWFENVNARLDAITSRLDGLVLLAGTGAPSITPEADNSADASGAFGVATVLAGSSAISVGKLVRVVGGQAVLADASAGGFATHIVLSAGNGTCTVCCGFGSGPIALRLGTVAASAAQGKIIRTYTNGIATLDPADIGKTSPWVNQAIGMCSAAPDGSGLARAVLSIDESGLRFS